MYCPKCGWNNADDATKCANCFAELTPGQPQPTQQMPSQPQQPQPQQQPYAQQPPQEPYSQQPYAQQPYAPQYQPGIAQGVPDYLAWAIVVTVLSLICYCLFAVPLAFGIVAIVKSSEANNRKAVGDYLSALQASNSAKTWVYWAAGLEVVGLLFWIVIIMIAVVSGSKPGQF
jgi:hypothetical protein